MDDNFLEVDFLDENGDVCWVTIYDDVDQARAADPNGILYSLVECENMGILFRGWHFVNKIGYCCLPKDYGEELEIIHWFNELPYPFSESI